ncbi:multiple inositol polyphosphate phosphatase 1-like [Episyrphus balteatus]|uniref:multiple inositol polyphosphate phosphatase 1-like n=1 Tax=Episyrphus balteatus TaxID=286459 RepID=UPI002486B55A|nr:multiple inositol polyphosphate phosphatase 1-like [Episyrphus balteatus]XP_055842233.1 multiple inositol polyphosphate phosphatase 1-like [Episyrphus balteatus]
MKVLWITVILALSQYEAYASSECCEEYCFGTDKSRPQTLRFTSKTAYTLAKGNDIERNILPNCSPTKMWTLTRHGTRLPSAKTIGKAGHLEEMRDKIVNNYKVLKTKPDTGALCAEDFFSIKTWKFNSSITPEMENMLTPQGWEDLKLLAKTYQRQYPNILTKDYRPQNYLFRRTETQRTEESFKAYVEGLFGTNVWQTVHVSQPDGNDTLLRPYDYCPKWEENNSQKEGTEYMIFQNSALMNKTVADVSTRLGFQYALDFKDIELMWDMCRYEQAWNVDRTSAWCGAFTQAQLKVLEYYDDLRYYKKSGYGAEINSKLPCEIIKDMLFHLNSKTQPNAVTNFAHSTLIQTMITALGWYQDNETLTASNYGSMGDRNWRISKIDPFASNLVAIKYDCPADGVDTEKVLFLLNQNAVSLSWCSVGLCDWSAVMKRYNDFYHANCTETFCQSGASSISYIASMVSLLVAAIVYLIY